MSSPLRPERFIRAPAEDALGPGAPVDDLVAGIEQEHGVIGRALDQEPETFFALGQRLAPFPVLGDILEDAGDP